VEEPNAPERRKRGRAPGRQVIRLKDPDSAERWLPIAGYEGLYEVSDLGRVYSVPRHGVAGGILKPVLMSKYLCVNLPGARPVGVHILVARAFIGPRPNGMLVCHGPAGRFDNSLANLSYGTPAKNCGPDMYRDGTMLVGTDRPGAKLTDEIVRECRARVAAGESKAGLAREFGVSKPAIARAVTGETWRHVPFPDATEPPAA